MESKLKEKLLKLMRGDYIVAHKALFYYGKWTGDELNVTGYANLRDALSHLRRFFDPELEPDEQAEQLTCASEHVRRATTEAYQECFELFYSRAWKLYSLYRENALHHEQRLGYQGKYDHNYIKKELARLRNELKQCRRGKDGKELDVLVPRLVLACDGIRKLYGEIMECCQEYEQTSGSRLT